MAASDHVTVGRGVILTAGTECPSTSSARPRSLDEEVERYVRTGEHDNHLFHNCKRQTVGLPYTRQREWILEIAFARRETFAYTCEAYGRILELGKGPAERRALLAELERKAPPADQVDPAEYVDILREAVAARDGWKRILVRCAPPRRARQAAPRIG
jgi:hypothetical protein